MLRFIFIFISLFISLQASDISTKVMHHILSIVSEKTSYKVWIDKGVNVREIIKKEQFSSVENCQEADVLILEASQINVAKCKDKPSVVLDYDLLSKHKNAVAAFFWKKGRPNIVFLKKRIEKFKIKIPASYDKYVEEEIW